MTTIDELTGAFVPKARLDQLPDEFLAHVTSIVKKPDENYPKYLALYMDITIDDPVAIAQAEGETFTQKMREMHVTELLIPAMEECGISDTDDLVDKPFILKRKFASFEGSNPRWVPIPNSKKGKKVKKRTA